MTNYARAPLDSNKSCYVWCRRW